MAGTLIVELIQRSRSSGSQVSDKIVYRITGTTDPLVAEMRALAESPKYVVMVNGGLLPQNQLDNEAGAAPDIWTVTVGYGTADDKDKKQPTTSFDTTGATQKMTQSITTVNRYAAPGKTAPDHKGAIGVEKDKIEGVDVGIGSYTWTEKHYLPESIVTPEFKMMVAFNSFRTNEAQFRGFPVGTVLFQGMTGEENGREPPELTMKFSASPDVEDITIGDIEGMSKKGWEYLWVEYEEFHDTAAHRLVKRPIAVHVEQVFYSFDFSRLKIPQGPKPG